MNDPGYPKSNNAAAGGSAGAVLWRRKGMVILFALLGLGGGYAYFTQQPATYSASAAVQVAVKNGMKLPIEGIEGAVDFAPSPRFIQAEITSDRIIRRAVQLGQLASLDGDGSDVDAVVNRIRRVMKVSPVTDSRDARDRVIVNVSFSGADPAFCRDTVNSVVDAYAEYLSELRKSATEDVMALIHESRQSIMPQFERLEKEYLAFRDQAPLTWGQNGEAINPFRADVVKLEATKDELEGRIRDITGRVKLIEDVQGSQNSAAAVLQEVQTLFNQSEALVDNDPIDSLVTEQDATLEIERTLVPLLIREEALRSQFGANHPARVAVQNEITATRATLRSLESRELERLAELGNDSSKREERAELLLGSYVSGLKRQQELLATQIGEVEEQLAAARQNAAELMAFENKDASFNRRLARFQGMLETLDAQLEKADLPTAQSGPEVRVLQPAGMGYQTGPDLKTNLMYGAVLGAALGVLLGLGLDWSERTFRSPDEIADSLAIAILAHVPMFDIRPLRRRKREPAKKYDTMHPSLQVLHQPHSPAAEAIRAVRTSLFYNRGDDVEYRVIQVTSPCPSDGKSTVAANLAVSLAGANKRVVLVDADLRKPFQHKNFGLDNSVGVTSVLNGDCDWEAAVQQTPVDNLSVMPSGPRPDNPAEAVSLPDFEHMIDDLRAEFDVVIVDSPPLLAVTDAANITRHVDGVVLVTRIGRNTKPLARRATQMLRSLKANVIGLVVNAVGDSGYSMVYASTWSSDYGGRPGTEFGYNYGGPASRSYQRAASDTTMTVVGRAYNHNRRSTDAGATAVLEPPVNGHAANGHKHNGHKHDGKG